MKTIKGPGIFLAQFFDDQQEPFNNLSNMCKWAAGLGYKGVQIPSNVTGLMDLEKAANSQDYADELKGIVNEAGLEITELSAHIQGQLVAVHPAYDLLFDNFGPAEARGNVQAKSEWATRQMKFAAKASRRLGLNACAAFSGALLWPMLYPWPQRPAGLVDQGFAELGKRWKPILNAFEEEGVDVCFELHPGEDLHDGVTFERFLEEVGGHSRANILYDPSHFLLQCMDYLEFIDIYHERIRMFHVKDAEFNPSGRQGVYGGFQGWVKRAGRFRSLGDGQVDFTGVFSKLTEYGFDGWAVMEWECALKSAEQGAEEGANFISDHIIHTTGKAFDDFADAGSDAEKNKRILGIN
ncbi:sugar phosphate isomerase/epimerase family protein [Roseivirga sp. BDSF3-8]|uniref:sugar phosphate isomerase/epimerase family protein n=1 Tax=Roseivirga sp. BDSF3-8 TaxID=3241598 RepID=UPI0035324598